MTAMMAKFDAQHESNCFNEGLPAAETAAISKKASLDDLLDLYQESLAQSQQVIDAELESHVRLIPKVSHHLLDAGGKRIRSLLLLAAADLTCRMTGRDAVLIHRKVLGLSAAVELIHTATLLHDDVVDNSTLRRGQPTVNHKWDNKLPVLVGDYLFSRAFSLMVESESLAVLGVLSRTSAQLAEGEVLQLQYERDPELTYEIYMQIIAAKTASLFEAACRSGAMLASAHSDDDALVEKIGRLGQQLGMIFQLSDDIMDYSASADEMGKRCGDDLREGKVTLPFILLWQQASLSERKWLAEVIRQSANDEDLAKIQQMMAHYGVIAESRAQTHQRADEARRILRELHDADERGEGRAIVMALHSALDFFVKRIY